MDPIHRILDANLNRAREGLRVAEELARLVLEDAPLQKRIKAGRHAITRAEALLPRAVIASRAAALDPGARSALASETRRATLLDLARANLRRSQEALRVLEEVSKLKSTSAGQAFKRIRFLTYDLERDLLARLEKNTKYAEKKCIR
jgi:thiamine-phosphate pyrophosphorylase